jgi:hypothetical protein
VSGTENGKTTLETSGEDGKTTLETSGEDVVTEILQFDTVKVECVGIALMNKNRRTF